MLTAERGDHVWLHRRRRCAAAASPTTCARRSRTAATSASTSTCRSARNGDVYDRYLVRMLEMDQSLKIVQQALDGMPEGRWQVDDPKIVAAAQVRDLLQHGGADPSLQALHRGLSRRRLARSICAPSRPRVSLASIIVSDGSAKPYRMHVRAPSFANLAGAAADDRGPAARGCGGGDRQHRHRAGRGGPLMISDEVKAQMREIAARYPTPRSAMLPCLHLAQEAEGYITAEGMQAVAEAIGDQRRRGRVGRLVLLDVHARKPARRARHQGLHQHLLLSARLRRRSWRIWKSAWACSRGETTADGHFTLRGDRVPGRVWHGARAPGERRVRRERDAASAPTRCWIASSAARASASLSSRWRADRAGRLDDGKLDGRARAAATREPAKEKA